MVWFVSSGKNKVVTKEFPKVAVKDRLKKVEISGHSRMTDPGTFYEKLGEQLVEYYNSFNKTLLIDFRLEYINTGSSKWLFHILSGLQTLAKQDGMIEITWFYEEDDEIILEAGEVLQSVLNLSFTIRAISK